MLGLSDLPTTPGALIDDRYRVEAVIGEGSMGIVVRAKHLKLGTKVAVKFLLPEMVDEQVLLGRFAREAKVAAQLTSDHVARVIDVGTLESGSPYMVMEYLSGETLAKVVKREGQLSIADACGYMTQVCSALDEAHKLGITHRDLKPANLFLADRPNGTQIVKVLDFGISKIVASSTALTNPAAVLGTPMYMAPEQLTAPSGVDARADIWSCGVCLYWMLTGAAPFEVKNLIELKMRLQRGPTPNVLAVRPDVPAELAEVIRRCLEIDVEKRWPSAAALSGALERFTRPRKPVASEPTIAPKRRQERPASPLEAPTEETAVTIARPIRESSHRRWADEGSDNALTVAQLGPAVAPDSTTNLREVDPPRLPSPHAPIIDRDAPTIARELESGKANVVPPPAATTKSASPGLLPISTERRRAAAERDRTSRAGRANKTKRTKPTKRDDLPVEEAEVGNRTQLLSHAPPRPSNMPPAMHSHPGGMHGIPQAGPSGPLPPLYDRRNAPTAIVSRHAPLSPHVIAGVVVVIVALLAAVALLARLGGCFTPERAAPPAPSRAHPAR